MSVENAKESKDLDNIDSHRKPESLKDPMDIYEETLLRKGKSCREIVDMAPEMLWILDQDYNIIYANQALLWYAGCCMNDFVKLKWKDLIHPEDMNAISEKIQTSLNLQNATVEEIRFLRFDGSYLWHRVKVNPFHDEAGNFAGFIGVNTDINELKQAQETLMEAKEAAEAANKAKSEFLANMSHELRTPINGIGGMIDLTLLTSLTEDQRYKLTTARECVNSLVHIINDILDYEKLEAEKVVLEHHNFNTKEWLEDIINTHGPIINQKGLIFKTNISPDLPENLYGDINKLSRVINKLLGNACKFTQSGSITLSISLISRQENKVLIKFGVKDTGIGIAKEDQSSIFNSFCQVDGSYARRFGGIGLGLAISKKLVELMGGILSVESDHDMGSNFYFFLETIIGETKISDDPFRVNQADIHSETQYETATTLETMTATAEVEDSDPVSEKPGDGRLNELELDLNIMESAIRYDNPEILRFMLNEILEIAREELRSEEIALKVTEGIVEYEKKNMKRFNSKLRSIREVIEQHKKKI